MQKRDFMDHKYQKIYKNLQSFNESETEWIELIHSILYTKPFNINIGLIQDYPENMLSNLSILLEHDKKLLFFYHDRLIDVFRELNPISENAEYINVFLNVFSKIKPSSYAPFLREKLISGQFQNLNWQSENLHEKLLLVLGDFDNVSNKEVPKYLLDNIDRIIKRTFYLKTSIRYFKKVNPEDYLTFIEKVANITVLKPVIEILKETIEEFVNNNDPKVIFDWLYKDLENIKNIYDYLKDKKLMNVLQRLHFLNSQNSLKSTDATLLYVLLNRENIIPVQHIIKLLVNKEEIQDKYQVDTEDLLSDYFDRIYVQYSNGLVSKKQSVPYIYMPDLSIFALNLRFGSIRKRITSEIESKLENLSISIANDIIEPILYYITQPPQTKSEMAYLTQKILL